MQYQQYQHYGKYVPEHYRGLAIYNCLNTMFDRDLDWLRNNLGAQGLRWDISYQTLAGATFVFIYQEDCVLFKLSCGDQ